jgi:hypothetical protein
MARPIPSAFTERWYAALPEHYRDRDEGLDYPLLRWMSLLGDQAGEVFTLLTRIQYIPIDDGGVPGDTSDLADPSAADEAWLPWLGELVGVTLPPAVTGQAARDAVAGAVNGYQVGTKTAIANAARSGLTGSRYVSVYDHTISAPGDGGIWDVLIVTRAAETPDINAVINAVTTKNAKPAGVVLHYRAYTATWTAMETAYGPAWSARNGMTWAQLQEAGL